MDFFCWTKYTSCNLVLTYRMVVIFLELKSTRGTRALALRHDSFNAHTIFQLILFFNNSKNSINYETKIEVLSIRGLRG
jgi:hypothetical protein